MYQFAIDYQLGSDQYALRLVDRSGSHITAATNIAMEEIQPGVYVDSFIKLDRAEAQTLFNALWGVGFRPADGTGNGGHIEALKYHLEDMRKLVFKDESSS